MLALAGVDNYRDAVEGTADAATNRTVSIFRDCSELWYSLLGVSQLQGYSYMYV